MKLSAIILALSLAITTSGAIADGSVGQAELLMKRLEEYFRGNCTHPSGFSLSQQGRLCHTHNGVAEVAASISAEGAVSIALQGDRKVLLGNYTAARVPDLFSRACHDADGIIGMDGRHITCSLGGLLMHVHVSEDGARLDFIASPEGGL